jgi:hypothetical protein
MVSAVRSSMPRKHRRRATRARSGSRCSATRRVVFHRAEAGDGFLHRPQVREVGLPVGLMRPGLLVEPRPVSLRPCPRRREASPLPQQEFRQPMAPPQQVRPNVFATAQEIADGFFLLGRYMHGGQCPGPGHQRRLRGIATARLHPVPRPPPHQHGGNHLAGHASRAQKPLQGEAARPRLVVAVDGASRRHLLHGVSQPRQIRRDGLHGRYPIPRRQHRRDDRLRMQVKGDDGSRLRLDRPPLYAALL